MPDQGIEFIKVLGSMNGEKAMGKEKRSRGGRRSSGCYGYGKCAGRGEKAEKLCLQNSVKQSGKHEVKA